MGKGKSLKMLNRESRQEHAVAERDGVLVIEAVRQGVRVIHIFPQASTEESRSHMEAFRRDAVRLLLEESWS